MMLRGLDRVPIIAHSVIILLVRMPLGVLELVLPLEGICIIVQGKFGFVDLFGVIKCFASLSDMIRVSVE